VSELIPAPRLGDPQPGAGILVVEDQPELVRALRINLRARQYEVLTARTGREALAVAASHPPDAIILDLGLPDIDGTEVIAELRQWYHAPIIVLSGRTSPGDKIGALDAGADDYVTKPFAMAELLARLRAALRRELSQELIQPVPVGQWEVDLVAHQVSKASVASAQLLTGVWGPGYQQRTNYLRFHMARLRRKLEDDPARPRYLLTEPGMGYRYQP
jgi:two-component system KDP operon response regulator KdpE